MQPQVYQQQAGCYVPVQHHTPMNQSAWQPAPLYEARPSRGYPEHQAVPQQPPRQHDSSKHSHKHVQQPTWQQKQQLLNEQQLQQQKLQQQQIQQQQQHLQQQQQQLQEQQQQLDLQRQMQQEQQQMKQISYLHKNEEDLTDKYQGGQPPQESIPQEYSTKATLMGNGKIGRHEAVPISEPLRLA